jgi:glutathione peroxidase
MAIFSKLFAGPLLLSVLLAWQGQAYAQTAATAASSVTAPACPAILQHQFPRLQDDAPQNLCQYAGKVILVVNTASHCGFTSQYEGLEALYAQYQSKGLVVLGFPSNEFGQQEPGNAKQIAELCFNTYGVKFPMFAKSAVKGAGQNGLYRAIQQSTGKTPQWNFHKFLIDRNGKVVDHFYSMTAPQSPKIIRAIEKAL